MSPGQTGHITGQMGRVPGTDGTHTRGCPAKILYVYWFFFFPILSKKLSNLDNADQCLSMSIGAKYDNDSNANDLSHRVGLFVFQTKFLRIVQRNRLDPHQPWRLLLMTRRMRCRRADGFTYSLFGPHVASSYG